jgi:hypothetical protein
VNISKAEVIRLIESTQGRAAAEKAVQELPAIVDHLEHAPLLARFGIDPEALLQRVGGAQGIQGAVEGLLGGHAGAQKHDPKAPHSA